MSTMTPRELANYFSTMVYGADMGRIEFEPDMPLVIDGKGFELDGDALVLMEVKE